MIDDGGEVVAGEPVCLGALAVIIHAKRGEGKFTVDDQLVRAMSWLSFRDLSE